MSEQEKTAIFKQTFYTIVLKCLRRADVTKQTHHNNSWIYAIANLPKMVYRGYEYVQPCLYGRMNPKEALFGGIQYYQTGLPHNPIIKRVFLAWRKQNPIDPKGKMKNEILWIYPAKFDGLEQLVRDWPREESERRQEAQEAEAHEKMLIDSGYYDDMEDDDHDDDYEDFYYPDDF